MPKPIPVPPPVTSATLPASRSGTNTAGALVATSLTRAWPRHSGTGTPPAGAQLVVNLAWSPTFFAGHAVTTAFFLILAILGLATAATLEFWRIRRAAGLLMIPYLLWLAFAGYLTYRIDRLNPDAETLVPRAGSADIAL